MLLKIVDHRHAKLASAAESVLRPGRNSKASLAAVVLAIWRMEAAAVQASAMLWSAQLQSGRNGEVGTV